MSRIPYVNWGRDLAKSGRTKCSACNYFPLEDEPVLIAKGSVRFFKYTYRIIVVGKWYPGGPDKHAMPQIKEWYCEEHGRNAIARELHERQELLCGKLEAVTAANA